MMLSHSASGCAGLGQQPLLAAAGLAFVAGLFVGFLGIYIATLIS